LLPLRWRYALALRSVSFGGGTMIDDFMHNLRALLRADSIIAEVRWKQVIAGSGLGAISLVFVFFAIAMLNVAAFFAIGAYWPKPWAACAVAGADLFIAMLAMLRATHPESTRTLQLARETRRSALDAIESSVPGLVIMLVEMMLKKQHKKHEDQSS
jgi:hypothetical protein